MDCKFPVYPVNQHAIVHTNIFKIVFTPTNIEKLAQKYNYFIYKLTCLIYLGFYIGMSTYTNIVKKLVLNRS